MEFSADHPVLHKYAIILRGFYTPAAIDINEKFQINENITSFSKILRITFS
jgi:hypothetical protein